MAAPKKKASKKKTTAKKSTGKKTTTRKKPSTPKSPEPDNAESRLHYLVEGLATDQDDQLRRRAQVELADPDAPRPIVRKLLIEALQEERHSDAWGGRGWVAGTLARVMDDDPEAVATIEQTLFDEKIEPEPFVRYWALEGLHAGGVYPDGWLERASQDSAGLVSALAAAMLAENGETEHLLPLQDSLEANDPEDRWMVLRALRVVPLPELRESVQAILASPADAQEDWNARLALRRLDEVSSSPPRVAASVGDGPAPPPRDQRDAVEPRPPPTRGDDPQDAVDAYVAFTGNDYHKALEIIDGLKANGLRVAGDSDVKLGGKFSDRGPELALALEQAACVVVLLSRKAFRDPGLLNAASEARETGRLCPVLIDRLDDAEPKPNWISDDRAANLIHWGGRPDHPDFQELVVAIQRLRDRVFEGREPAAPSPRPSAPVPKASDVESADPSPAPDVVAQQNRSSVSESPSSTPPVASSIRSESAPSDDDRDHEDTEGVAERERQAVQPQPGPHPTPTIPANPLVILRERYRAPKAASTLVLELDQNTSVLRLGDDEYVSPLELDEVELREKWQQPRVYGELLFKAAINRKQKQQTRLSTRHGYDEAMKETGGLTFELVVRDKALRGIAWERLCEPKTVRPPIATNENTPFFRRAASREIDTLEPPLRIVAAICSPPGLAELGLGLASLDVGEENEMLEHGLRRLTQSGLIRSEILPQQDDEVVTLKMLTDRLQEDTHVLHLLAHGVFLGEDQEYYIVMGSGPRPLVKAIDLAEALVTSKVRLAVLQCCQSGFIPSGQPGEDAPQALGTILVDAGLPAVVSMQDKLGMLTAQAFNQRFYHHLARSGRVDMALAATRFNLRQEQLDTVGSWSIPVLHLGSKTGELFKVDEPRAASLEDKIPDLLKPDELQARRDGAESHIDDALRDTDVELTDDQRAKLADQLSTRLAPQAGSEAEVLIERQDRSAIGRKLRAPRKLDATRLQDYVKRQTGLELPPLLYKQVAGALFTGKHVMLIGPPGTGKTSLAHAIASFGESNGWSCGAVAATASADWTTFDTVGGYVPTASGQLAFRPGLFLRAIGAANWLVVDEMNRAEIDKAIGELFTVLSGQTVDLPYRIGGQAVRVLPPTIGGDWVPEAAAGLYDFVVHPSWRVIGTMNVYDRSSLFSMSFAFMRRFAFIDVGVPQPDQFDELRGRWLGADHDAFADRLKDVFDPAGALMKWRELGPAIAKDMIEYLKFRRTPSAGDGDGSPDDADLDLLAETVMLYAVPQLDGLASSAIKEVYSHLNTMFRGAMKRGPEILSRIEDLYPHVQDWPQRLPDHDDTGQ